MALGNRVVSGGRGLVEAEMEAVVMIIGVSCSSFTLNINVVPLKHRGLFGWVTGGRINLLHLSYAFVHAIKLAT